MNDIDDNEEDIRDMSKADIEQEMEQMPIAAQVVRQSTTADTLKKLN